MFWWTYYGKPLKLVELSSKHPFCLSYSLHVTPQEYQCAFALGSLLYLVEKPVHFATVTTPSPFYKCCTKDSG